MLRSVFLKSLRDQTRSLLWWLFGVVAYIVFVMLFYPTLRQNSELLNDYLQAFPEAFRLAFIGEVEDITSPNGFLASYVFSLIMPIILLVYAIIAGGDAIAGEEERGTLDLLLANPVSRSRVYLEKAANVAAGVLLISLATWASVVLGALPVDMSVSALRVAEVCVSLALFGLALGALALAVGAATGKKGTAGGVAAAVALFSYLMYSFAPSVAALRPYRAVSLLYLYNGADPLSNGLNLVHLTMLVAFTVACVAVGLYFFRRRDLAV
ncbi:MAG: ABC transporter permease subunit [Anaerolineae bacterium]|nr:ABC transporter permease subunit [Anaerolineae bacterium]